MRQIGVQTAIWPRRGLSSVVVCGLAIILAVGCASKGAGTAAPATSTASNSSLTPPSTVAPPTGASSSAVNIVGAWSVQAQGADANTVLVLGDDLEVWASCGVLNGGWAGDSVRQFVARGWGGAAACMPSPPPTDAAQLLPKWLADAASFTVSGSNATLLDDAGHVVAKLSRTSKDVANAQARPAGPYPPTPDARLTARLSAPSPMPPGVRPATSADIVGRWTPATGGANPKAFLIFGGNGSWQSYDGCNEDGGGWRAADGHIVAVGGAVAGVGCDNMTDLATPLQNASLVGITSSGALEFYSASGAGLAELAHAPGPVSSSTGD